MTEKKANEIFRTKYPEGEIVRRNNSSAGNKFWITFKPTGKVYYYACSTYAELLRRFGFEVVYKHDIKNAEDTLKEYEKQLKDAKNGNFNPFAFVFVERNEETEMQEIDDLQNKVNEYKKLLRHYKEDCIVD